jgi:hypothetical protein
MWRWRVCYPKIWDFLFLFVPSLLLLLMWPAAWRVHVHGAARAAAFWPTRRRPALDCCSTLL